MFKFGIKDLFALVAVIAAVLGMARMSYVAIERDFRRVHPSEQQIADRVRGLGGACTANKAMERHIIGVSLANTAATDADIQVVMRLSYLQSLDVSNTAVSDASLADIAIHKTLDELRVRGSAISKQGLKSLLSANDRIFLIDD